MWPITHITHITHQARLAEVTRQAGDAVDGARRECEAALAALAGTLRGDLNSLRGKVGFKGALSSYSYLVQGWMAAS